MRDDARARLEIEQPGAQFEVDPRQQVHRDHRRVAEVGFKQIPLLKRHAVGDSGLPGVGVRLVDALGIEIDAEAARLVLPRRRHDDPAVARSEIDHIVVGGHLCDFQHALDHLLRRGNVGHAGGRGPRAARKHRPQRSAGHGAAAMAHRRPQQHQRVVQKGSPSRLHMPQRGELNGNARPSRHVW